MPGISVHLARVFHGEQYLLVKRPLPAEGKVDKCFQDLDKDWFCLLEGRVRMKTLSRVHNVFLMPVLSIRLLLTKQLFTG